MHNKTGRKCCGIYWRYCSGRLAGMVYICDKSKNCFAMKTRRSQDLLISSVWFCILDRQYHYIEMPSVSIKGVKNCLILLIYPRDRQVTLVASSLRALILSDHAHVSHDDRACGSSASNKYYINLNALRPRQMAATLTARRHFLMHFLGLKYMKFD